MTNMQENIENLYEAKVSFVALNVDKKLTIEESKECVANKEDFTIEIPVYNGSKEEIKKAKKKAKKVSDKSEMTH